MIVNEELALERLNSPDNLVNKLNLERKELYSNRVGTKGIPPMVQTLAVTLAETTESERSVGTTFDISHQTVNYYKNEGKKVDRNFVKTKVSEVHDGAVDAMLEAIGLIKPKLEHVKKATDLSQIAANLGRVIEKTTPKEQQTTNLKIVVFAPNQKTEDQYETIDV